MLSWYLIQKVKAMQPNLNFRRESGQHSLTAKQIMEKKLKEMITKQYEDESQYSESIKMALNSFSYYADAEERDKALMAAVGEKLAEVFTIEVLKGMDQCFVLEDIFEQMILANTISSYEILNAFQAIGEEGLPPITVLMVSAELCDGSEILIANIREAYDETD